MNSATNTATAAPEAPETPRGINLEARKQLDDEIAAKNSAKAEWEAIESAKPAAAPKLQPETAADPLAEIPNLNLRRALASLHAHMEATPRPVTPEPQPKPPAKVVQLDFWEDGRRAAPNVVFRSALFPALNTKQERRYLEQERIFTTKGGEIFFTGKQFDQSDLDVYLEILQFARPFSLGTPVKFSAYSMLKALGRNTGKSDYEWLHAVLIRLRGGTVDMTDRKKRYVGGLIHDFIKDEITGHYEVIINPKFAVLFGFGLWSTLDKAQRQALKQNQTAKALHAYYASHAAPGSHEYATLAEVAGLKDKNPRKVKMKIIAAHEAMKRIGFMPDYEVGVTKIKVTINHTPSQARHIVKKIIKSRKKTRRNEA